MHGKATAVNEVFFPWDGTDNQRVLPPNPRRVALIITSTASAVQNVRISLNDNASATDQTGFSVPSQRFPLYLHESDYGSAIKGPISGFGPAGTLLTILEFTTG